MNEQFYIWMDQVILSRVIRTAVDLAIADHLRNSSMKLEELAETSASHPRTLYRLLRCLLANNIFTKNIAGEYANNEISHFMRKDHPHSVHPLILLEYDKRFWNAIGELTYSVKTGASAFEKIYGKNYFSYLIDQPELSSLSDKAMSILSANEDALIAKQIPLHGVIADIGGGQGQLLREIIANNQHVTKGILFERPWVIARIKDQISSVTFIEGNFFDPIIIEADVFILKRILHDWDDECALQILKHVSTAMKPESTLYIIESIFDHCDNKTEIANADMQMLAILGGVERDYSEFQSLISKANLNLQETGKIDSIMSWIKCTKKNRNSN